MANKNLMRDDPSVRATFAAVLEFEDVVKISGNKTVAKAALGDKPLGQVIVKARAANDIGTIDTKFEGLIQIKGSGALAANAEVKLGAADGSGNQQVVAFVEGTDAEQLRFGRVWQGGADGAILEVFTY